MNVCKLLRPTFNFECADRRILHISIQENVHIDPEDKNTEKKISVAIKGLSQLKMYDTHQLSGGNQRNPNWSVQLEQNPMPKPDQP